MTAFDIAAFRKAVAYARKHTCAECMCQKGGERYCPVLGEEFPRQCCLCCGGHDCWWWDLCQAGQQAREAPPGDRPSERRPAGGQSVVLARRSVPLALAGLARWGRSAQAAPATEMLPGFPAPNTTTRGESPPQR